MSDSSHSKSDRPMSGQNGAGHGAKLPAAVNGRRPRAGQLPPPVVNFTFVMHALRQWWHLAAPLGVILAATAGLVVWLLFEPVYRAVAYLEINTKSPFVAFPTGPDPNANANAATTLEVINAPFFMAGIMVDNEVKIIKEFQEAEDPREWLEKGLTVKALPQSRYVNITFDAKSSRDAQTVAFVVARDFLKLQDSARNSDRDALIRKLNEASDTIEIDVKGKQKTIRESVDALVLQGLPDPGARTTYLSPMSPLGKLFEQKADAEFELRLLDAQVQVLKQENSNKDLAVQNRMPTDEDFKQQVDASPEVQELAGRIAANEAKLQAYSETSRGDERSSLAPIKASLQRSVKSDQAKLNELREGVESRLRGQVKEAILTQVRDELKQAEAHSAGQILLRDQLQKLIEEQQVKIKAGGNSGVELEFLRADLRLSQDVYDRIRNRITQLKTEDMPLAPINWAKIEKDPVELRSANVKIASRPVVAVPYARMGLASGAAFCVPFVLAIFWERRVRRIADAQQISKELNLAVVGEITTLPMRSMLPGWRSTDRFERHRSTFEESIDCLRTSLMLAEDLQDLQVLVVASAASREGKTSLAAQLAVNLANCSRQPTLLIDGDMRDPDLHDMFGIPLDPGLADLLDGRCTVAEAINTSWSKRIHLLPAGQLLKNPHTLLANGIFEGALRDLRQKYRYIVIDSPPVLAASEALFVARAGDGTLMCTMRDVSRAPQLRLACDRLIDAGANVLGAVLSGIPPRSYAYKYGGADAYARRYALNQGPRTNGHSVPPTEPRSDVDDYGRDARS